MTSSVIFEEFGASIGFKVLKSVLSFPLDAIFKSSMLHHDGSHHANVGVNLLFLVLVWLPMMLPEIFIWCENWINFNIQSFEWVRATSNKESSVWQHLNHLAVRQCGHWLNW